jgi:DNA-binding CsgD family transcriptional regulator/pimeloyl-ACP methyl ester carboxylesterase
MRSPSIQYARSADGTRIAFFVVGRGLPLVLCPTPATHIQAEWQSPQLRGGVAALAERYRIVRYDRRGAGLSDRDVHDYALPLRVEDLTAVVDQLGLRRFVLVGQPHSLSEAVTFAVQQPERLAALILMSAVSEGAVYQKSPRFQYVQRSLKDDWETASLSMAGMLADWSDAELMRRHAAIIRETVTPGALEAFFAESAREDVTNLLEQLPMSVLVVRTLHGPFTTADATNRMLARIPDGRMAVVESHAAPLLGYSASVVEAIESFLSDIEADAGLSGDVAASLPETLSRRELEVLRLVASGLDNTEVAERLFISVNTVTRHLTHIYHKTGTTNRVLATRYAIERRLIE